jgi:hypothetical protein
MHGQVGRHTKANIVLLLKPSAGQKDEMKYTFEVSKCDKLFDVVMKGL